MSRLKQYLATRRAARNVVCMISGAMTTDDVIRLRRWREDSQEYQQSFVATNQIMAELQGLADDPELLALAEEPVAENVIIQWPKMAIAAVLVMAVFASYFIFEQAVEPADNVLRYVTRTGEQKTVSLSDGSQVTMNTSTLLLVENSDSSRRVILERGEAYFDVEPDPSRPFIVDLGYRSISVLGTEFNLLKSPDKFELSVVEGVVAIHRKGEIVSASTPALPVAKGDRIRIKATGQRRVEAGVVAEFNNETQELLAYSPKDISRAHSWRNGLLLFHDDPLYKVVKELNRYSAKKILIEDKSIMDLQIFTAIRIDSLQAALSGLEATLPIKVVSYVDRIVIVGKNQ